MIVKVTQEHINKAKENIDKAKTTEVLAHSCNCPIAAALKDTFKTKFARANYQTLLVGKFPEDNIIFEKDTPNEVIEWMNEYDIQLYEKRLAVEPFEFELSLEGVKL